MREARGWGPKGGGVRVRACPWRECIISPSLHQSHGVCTMYEYNNHALGNSISDQRDSSRTESMYDEISRKIREQYIYDIC